MKKIILILALFLLNPQISLAELPYYLDFKFILNESDAGKKAQTFLKKKLNNGVSSLNKRKNSSGRGKKYN